MKFIITENQYNRLINEEDKIKLNDPSIKIDKKEVNNDIINRNKTLLNSILNITPSIDLKNNLTKLNVNDVDFMSKMTNTLDRYGIDMFVKYSKSKGLNIATSINIPKLNNLNLNLSGNYVGFTFIKKF